jgi:shikimate O-hydroxycinnamoyltransferase
MADGRAAMNFTNAWAKLARGEDLGCDEMPFHDRIMLRSCETPPMHPRFDHLAFSKPPLLIGCSDTKAEQGKETSAVLLKVTKKQVEELLNKANQNMVLARPYSRYEAVVGHIWKCACKARAGDDFNQQELASELTAAIGSNYLSLNGTLGMQSLCCDIDVSLC